MKRLIAVAALAALVSPSAIAGTRLSGAGASFPSKIYSRWFSDYAKSGGHRAVSYTHLTLPTKRIV